MVVMITAPMKRTVAVPAHERTNSSTAVVPMAIQQTIAIAVSVHGVRQVLELGSTVVRTVVTTEQPLAQQLRLLRRLRLKVLVRTKGSTTTSTTCLL